MSRTRGTPSTVARWITRARSSKSIAAGDSLTLIVEGVSPSVVQRWESVADLASQPESLAQDVIDAAQDHADQQDTTTRYRLELEHEDGKAYSAFSLKLVPSDLEPSKVPDAPDYQGLLAQQMRHTEKLHQMLLTFAATSVKTIEALSQQNAVLVQDRTAMLERERALMTTQVQAESSIEAEEWKVEKEKRLLTKAERLFDMVAPDVLSAIKKGIAENARQTPGAPPAAAPAPVAPVPALPKKAS